MKWGKSKAFAPSQRAATVFLRTQREGCAGRKRGKSHLWDGFTFKMQIDCWQKGNVNTGNEATLYTVSGKEKVTHSSCLGPSQERRNAPLCGLWPSRTTQWWALCEPACGLKALLSSQVVCALLRSFTSLTPSDAHALIQANSNGGLCGKRSTIQPRTLTK